MFAWLKTKKVEAFARELAAVFIDTVPLSLAGGGGKLTSKTNYAKEKMGKRIRLLKQQEVLNFYKTAKLLNAFKWELKEAGYPAEFVEELTSWVFIALRKQNF